MAEVCLKKILLRILFKKDLTEILNIHWFRVWAEGTWMSSQKPKKRGFGVHGREEEGGMTGSLCWDNGKSYY